MVGMELCPPICYSSPWSCNNVSLQPLSLVGRGNLSYLPFSDVTRETGHAWGRSSTSSVSWIFCFLFIVAGQNIFLVTNQMSLSSVHPKVNGQSFFNVFHSSLSSFFIYGITLLISNQLVDHFGSRSFSVVRAEFLTTMDSQ